MRLLDPIRAFATAALIASSSFAAPPTTAPVAFPGAEGFGAHATGGRAGEVYRVTTLEDSGAGSFRDAVSEPNRMVVFDVAGVIKLKSNVSVSSGITIAGQSAPGDGVCLYGQAVSLSGQKNIIVRYLRMRQGIGGDRGKKTLNMSEAHNIIIDHCSIEWGRWDCLGITEGCSNITVQYCIIGEGLDPQRFGALVDSVENVTLSHNLWIHNHSRNPKAKGTIQYINNVIYDWRITGLAGGHSGADHYLDAINNCLIKGPGSNDTSIGGFSSTDQVYQAGNLVDLDRDGQLNGRPVAEKDFGGGPTFQTRPHMSPDVPVTVESAADAYKTVVTSAGVSIRRDAVDQRLIDDLTSLGKKGKIIDKESDVGGQGPIASAPALQSTVSDGIPDAWKTAHHLDAHDPKLHNQIFQGGDNAAGYTVLETYLNSLVSRDKAGEAK